MGERHVRIEISDFVMRTFVLIPGISLRDVSGISTKAPREAARVHEPHVRAEIADFVTRLRGDLPYKEGTRRHL